MADVNNWGAFILGRWKWAEYGYEDGFPRKCAFTDIDATTEFDGRFLVIEPKHHDGVKMGCPYPDNGQLGLLRREAELGKTVFVLYGCAGCNDPQAIRYIGATREGDRFVDWRKEPTKEARRKLLKAEIDRAMGLIPDSDGAS